MPRCLQHRGYGRVDDLAQLLLDAGRALDVAHRPQPAGRSPALRHADRLLVPLLQHGADLVHLAQVRLRAHQDEGRAGGGRRMRADLGQPRVLHVTQRVGPDDGEAEDEDVCAGVLAVANGGALILFQSVDDFQV